MKIRLAIVDDKIKSRLPLAGRLGYNNEIEVVFTAASGEEFLERAFVVGDQCGTGNANALVR